MVSVVERTINFILARLNAMGDTEEIFLFVLDGGH